MAIPSAFSSLGLPSLLFVRRCILFPLLAGTSLISAAVAQDATATQVTVSANQIAGGAAVNLYATIADTANAAVTPSGSVTFYDTYNGSTNAPVGAQTITNGQINLTGYHPSGNGVHHITAIFTPGTAAFGASRDNTGQLVSVGLGSTAVSFSLSAASVAAGSAVTFTANVLSAGSPYTGSGQINFCDTASPQCTDIHRLASVQIHSGVATYKFFPGPGTHTYRAVFAGTNAQSAVTSASATLTVTPTVLASISIAQGGSPGSYTEFTAVSGSGSAAPTGSVSFLDTTNGNYILGTGTLVPSAPSLHFTSSPSPATGNFPNSVVTADFNGDGRPDLAVANYNGGSGSVTILTGNGDGSFTTASTLTGFASLTSLAAGDFNNDGKLDLAVLNSTGIATPGTVHIFLGNGDGTFSVGSTPSTGNTPYSVAAGDFNSDGNLDLAVTNSNSKSITVLLGNGTGTFTAATLSPSTGNGPVSLVAGDFNHDGILDLAETDQNDTTLSVFLGHGDGSFASRIVNPLPGYSYALAMADLNGDGHLDLVAANYLGASANILLGHGDGTFSAAPYNPAVGNNPLNAAIADVNGDGIPDIITANANTTGTLSILLGAGDGTFAAGLSPSAGSDPHGVAAADFDGDGIPDLVTGDYLSSAAYVLLAKPGQASTVNAPVLTPVGSGTHNIIASYPGDSLYAAAVSGVSGLTAQAATTTLSLAANPASSTSGQQVTLTASLSPATAQNHSTDGVILDFTRNGTHLAYGALSAGAASINTSTLPAGTGTLAASFSGNTNFSSSNSPGLAYSVANLTTTSLTLSAHALPQGSSATLTATVLSGTSPVTAGTVVFCDAVFPHCTDVHLLGTAQLTPSGNATLKVIPSLGAHTYKALFLGTDVATPSFSASASLSISGAYTTSTTLQSSGTRGNYTLAATVSSSTPAALTGTVSFLDTTNSNFTLGVTNVTSTPATPTFGNSQSPTTGSHPYAVVTGDFNRDGKPDFAVANHGANTLSIFLGNGDGTFTSAANPPGTYSNPSAVLSADFNNDGISDLAVLNNGNDKVVILLGNGDGTFSLKPSNAVGSNPLGLTFGDFNRDGNLDLAVTSSSTAINPGTVTILLGAGDGTFTAAASPTTGVGPQGVVSADFNNDGLPDLAVANANDGSVSLLFGAGDGTFPTSLTVAAVFNASPFATLAAGDLNGDGNQDLAVASYGTPAAAVLLGDGTGHFTASTTPATGSHPISVAVGDVNGDGRPDLILASENTSGTVSILLGTGTGTFQAAISASTGGNPNAVALADFNNDGFADIVTADYTPSTATVLVAQLIQTASGTVTGISPAGSQPTPSSPLHAVEATYSGDATHAASLSSTVNLEPQQVATILTLTQSSAISIPGQSVTFFATLAPFTAQTHTTDGQVVNFGYFVNNVFTPVQATLSGGVATLTISTLSAGNTTISAYYSGDINFSGSATNVSHVVQATTTTSLAILSGGSPVSSAAQGTLLTLTATVQSGTTPITPGQVLFCDAAAPHCSDAHLLGVAQLTPAGTASLRLAAVRGLHTYKAVFPGAGQIQSSTSASASITGTGVSPTTITLASSGVPASYTLAATVTVADTATPTGTVTFADAVHNTTFGTASLSPLSSSFTLLNTQTPATGVTPNSVATADFNNDGYPDFVTTNSNGQTVSILLGNGNGSFTAAATLTGFLNPSFVSVADFNSDGIADLAIANTGTNQVFIFLGAGDGTFRAPATATVGSTPYALSVADLNNDGIPDIAVANTFADTVSILLGVGDGTFTNVSATPATGNGPTDIVAADYNNDGIADLAVTNLNSNSVTILLGTGDGTFTTGTTLTGVGNSYHLVAADLNSDGNQDLAVADSGGNSVKVFLGDGHGGFSAQATSLATGSSPNWIASTDLNADGIPDLITANRNTNDLSILLGNGDGTFQAAVSQATGNVPNGIAFADFNGDGIPDLVAANSGSDSASAFITQLSISASATLPNVSEQGTGTYTATAAYAGDTYNAASTSNSVILTTVPYPVASAPTFSPAAGVYSAVQSVTLTTSTSGAAIFYTLDGSTPTASSSRYTAPLAVNVSETIRALAAGSNFQPSSITSAIYTINVPPTITTQPMSQTINTGQTATLTALATGTAPLTYTWYSGQAPSTANPVANGPSFTTPILTTTTSYWVQVTNASNLPASSNTVILTVNQPPTCTLSVQASSTPLVVTAVSVCVDPQNLSLTETLAWGDGTSTPASAASTHTYASPGTYNVVLTAQDSAGLSSSVRQQVTPLLPVAASPNFSPAAGSYTSTETVTIASSTPNASIFYTTDGSVPTTSSTPYTAPIPVTATETVRAVAAASNFQLSPVGSATYIINIPPTITTQPVSQTVNSGQTGTLTALATGTAPLTYTWYAGQAPSTANPVATGPTFVTPALTATASYWVQVTNASNIPALSNTAIITVITGPAIIAQSPNATINRGQTATLSITTTGSQPTFQWYAGQASNTAFPIAGAASAAYTTPALAVNTSFWVRATNAAGHADSTTFLVTVNQPPVCTLSVQPSAAALTAIATTACSDPQNQPLTQSLNWGDGTVVPASATAVHTYTAAGTFVVTLTATDAAQLTSAATATISPNQSPVCTLGVAQGQIPSAAAPSNQYPVSVAATCTDPQGKPLTAIIDWGDGTAVPTVNGTALHTYIPNPVVLNPGTVTYTVVLSATDSSGLSGASSPLPIKIAPAAAIAPGGSSPVNSIVPALPVAPALNTTQVTFVCSSVSALVNGVALNNVLPATFGISCDSPIIPLTGGITPLKLSIDTSNSVAHASLRPQQDWPGSRVIFSAVCFPLLGFVFLPGRHRRRKVSSALVLIFVVSLCSCGGYFQAPPSAVTPAATYFVNVVEVIVSGPVPTGFVQTSLIVPLPVSPSVKP